MGFDKQNSLWYVRNHFKKYRQLKFIKILEMAESRKSTLEFDRSNQFEERSFEKLTKKSLKFSGTPSNRGSGSPGGSSSGYYTPPSVGGLEAAEASNSKKGSSPESSQRNSVSSESEDPGCSDSEDQTSAPSLTSTRCLKRLCALKGVVSKVNF